MGSMSNYLENKLVDFLFRGVSYTAPAAIAIALCTTAPTDTSTGATIVEVPNSASYARVALSPSTSNWRDTAGGTAGTSAGTTGTTSNNATITFPTSSGSWGTVTHFAVVDSATWGAGNVLFWGAIGASVNVTGSGFTLSFSAGQLSVQLDD